MWSNMCYTQSLDNFDVLINKRSFYESKNLISFGYCMNMSGKFQFIVFLSSIQTIKSFSSDVASNNTSTPFSFMHTVS